MRPFGLAALLSLCLFTLHPSDEAAAGLSAPLVRLISGDTAEIDLELILPEMASLVSEVRFSGVSGEDIEDGVELWRAGAAGGRLVLRASPRTPSLATLAVTDQSGRKAWLPVWISQPPLHIYIYRSEGGVRPAEVSVAGSFNGWSGTAWPLSDPDGDGVFIREERLTPGRYIYKFVVDGKWIADPGNPNRSPDGFGGENSILDAGAAAAQPPRIVPWAVGGDRIPNPALSEHALEEVVFHVSGKEALNEDQILILCDGRPVERENRLYLNHSYLIVQIPADYQTLRVEALTVSGARAIPFFLDRRPSAAVRDDVLYFAMTDRFLDGDTANNRPIADTDLEWDANYQGGDFAGIAKKIEDGYFTSLGVSMLWISPPNDQPESAFKDSLPPYKLFTGYHGYWPTHHERTEDRFGTLEELRSLVTAAHGRGIRVIFDFVANHVHDEHPFFKEHPDWFGSVDLPGGGKNIRKWENPFTTWFDEFLPDIDYDRDTPLEAMASNARWWLDQTGADGFRLDAVKHVPDKFWTRLRRAMGDSPVYFVGETIDSRKTISRFVGPGALDGQFDFPLYWPIRDIFASGRGGFADLDAALSDGEADYDPTAVHSTLLGNHDVARFMAFADGDPEVGETVAVDNPDSYRKLSLAFAFLMTQSGIPMIYYGDEIGLTGGKDPDNRRMMKFGNEAGAEGHRVRENLSRLAEIRHAHPALSRGSRRTLHASDTSYVYIRTYFDDRVIVALNRSADTAALELETDPDFGEGEIRGLMGGATAAVNDLGRVRVEVPPMGAEIWVPAKR